MSKIAVSHYINRRPISRTSNEKAFVDNIFEAIQKPIIEIAANSDAENEEQVYNENEDDKTSELFDIDLCKFKTDLVLFNKHNAQLERTSAFSYDTRSMFYSTFYSNINIKKGLPKYNGQYCFVCGLSEGKLSRCCKDGCLSTYHKECINPNIMGDYFAFLKMDKILCPRHHCTTCFAEHNRTTAFQHMNKFYYCIYCTSAYHEKCLPAGCPRKGNKIICHQHIKLLAPKDPVMPYCFACRQVFDDDGSSDKSEGCLTCVRSFHNTCARVNMRDRICFSCENKWSPRKGQLCHVYINKRFYPAQVANKDYKKAINLTGNIPVFLFSNYTRNVKDIELIPRSLIVPMIQFEPFEAYYEKFSNAYKFISKYQSTLESLSFDHLFPISSKTIKQLPEFKRDRPNVIPKSLQNVMLERSSEYEPSECKCQPINGYKCVDRTCVNRYSGVECNEECGSECMNGPSSRIVTDSVEIVAVPFGGFGLQAVKTIPKGHPIGEYTGAILDIEKTRKMLEIHELQLNQESPLYLMHIYGNLHINSGPNGNSTRFANHSCSPNTEVGQIMGNDFMPHQLLYAKRQIEVGEEITFDYGHTWSKFNPRCFCGSKLCSGHLSGKLKRVFIKEKKTKPTTSSTKNVGRKRKLEGDPEYGKKGCENV